MQIAEVPKWKRDYFTACNKVILAETLSPTFVGLQFRQVRTHMSEVDNFF